LSRQTLGVLAVAVAVGCCGLPSCDDRREAHPSTSLEASPDEGYRDFEWAAVERKFEAPPIEDDSHEGWAWWELKGSVRLQPDLEPDRGAARSAMTQRRRT